MKQNEDPSEEFSIEISKREHREPGSSFVWRLWHVLFFALGGSTFIIGLHYAVDVCLIILVGTICYFPQSSEYGPTVGAAWYTIGSFGFLGVDVQEFFTFKTDFPLRTNIAISVIGSTLYIIGSIGFFPQLEAPAVGIWGFILGSAFIGCSQVNRE